MRHVLSLFSASAVVLALAGVGCERVPSTQYVAGFSTQVQVPKEFKTIEVGVFVAGDATQPPALVECHIAEVKNGRARLPKTLGVQRKTDNQNMTVVVVGHYQERDKIDRDCAIAPQIAKYDPKADPEKRGARIIRRSRQNYRDGKVLYLPMPLKYACFDVPCAETETCAAGKCVAAARNELSFREYSAELTSGDASVCFSMQRCLADAVVPKLEDPATCTYSVPGTLEGMNVRAVFDGFVTEVLDEDKLPPKFDELSPAEQDAVRKDVEEHAEGFTIVAPGKFRLAKGLCELTKPLAKGDTRHRLLSLAASRACAPKAAEQPVCDEEGDVLIPAPSKLHVLLDRSAPMQDFFSGGKAIDQILGLSLDDPVFTTTQVALSWLPGPNTSSCQVPAAEYATPDFDYLPTLAARDAIIDAMKTQAADGKLIAPVGSPITALTLEGAYASLINAPDAKTLNRRALVLVTNNGTGDDCSGAAAPSIKAAIAAAANQGIRTYLIQLGVKNETDDGNPNRQKRVAQANDLASAQNAAACTTSFVENAACFDATAGTKDDKSVGVAAAAMATIVADLSSCVYQKPGSISDPSKTKIGIPGLDIPFNAGCKDASSAVDGWNVNDDGTLIRVCGQPCKLIRAFNLQGNEAVVADLNSPDAADKLASGNVAQPRSTFLTAIQTVPKP